MNKSFGKDNKHLEWNNIRAEKREKRKRFLTIYIVKQKMNQHNKYCIICQQENGT